MSFEGVGVVGRERAWAIMNGCIGKRDDNSIIIPIIIQGIIVMDLSSLFLYQMLHCSHRPNMPMIDQDSLLLTPTHLIHFTCRVVHRVVWVTLV